MNMNEKLNTTLGGAQPKPTGAVPTQAANVAGGSMSIMDKLNATTAKAAGEYKGWEAGEYTVQIEKAEMGEASNGNPYAAVTFKDMTGANTTSERQTVWFINFDGDFDEAAVEKFKGQVQKLGIDTSDFQTMLGAMLGKQLTLKIKQFPNPSTGEMGKRKHYFYEAI